MMAKMISFHPDIANWILLEGYGKVLSRKFIDTKTRELLIISNLIALGLWRQLPSHIQGALNVGVHISDVENVLEAIKSLIKKTNLKKAYYLLHHLTQ